MDLQDVTYETLLVYAINRLRKEYVSISAFTRSIDCKQLGFRGRKGKPTGTSILRQYLSYTEGKKINKSMPFMIKLFKGLWDIDIIYKQIIVKKTVLKANLY